MYIIVYLVVGTLCVALIKRLSVVALIAKKQHLSIYEFVIQCTSYKEMAMSRKDFEIIAKHISEIADRNTRVEAATAVAAACMKINSRFNITKFYEACNVLL